MVKVIYGLLLSVTMGFPLGWLVIKFIETIFRSFNRKRTARVFQYAQIAGGAGMAFMHGAQDGQKFSGYFMGVFLANGQANVTEFIIPFWLIVLLSRQALGTSSEVQIIRLLVWIWLSWKNPGFPADLAAAVSLLTASVLGLHLTPHAKTSAIGCWGSKRLSNVNWGVVKMALAWILTFRLWNY